MAEDMTELEQRERNERCSMRVHRVLTSKNELVRLKDIDSDWNAWVSPVFKGITFEVISTRHHEFTEAWKASSTYQACYKLLNEVMVRQEKLKITACMCLGLGSFTGIQPISGYDFRKAALSQLVAFEGWVDQLKTKYDIEHVYFQEPEFNALDQQFLKSRGYEILHTPESDDRMSGTTFLFTPGAEQSVVESSLVSAFPMLYINGVLTRHSTFHVPPDGPYNVEHRQRDEDIPAPDKAHRKLINAFLSQCATVVLPQSDLVDWFREMRIYYKPDREADVSPFEWDVKEEDIYTHKQAAEVWRKKGLVAPDYVSWHYWDSEDETRSEQGSYSPDDSDNDGGPHSDLPSGSIVTDHDTFTAHDTESVTADDQDTVPVSKSLQNIKIAEDVATLQQDTDLPAVTNKEERKLPERQSREHATDDRIVADQGTLGAAVPEPEVSKEEGEKSVE